MAKRVDLKSSHSKLKKKIVTRDFPGGPVVKTSPSNAVGAGSIPGRGAKIPHASRPKNQNTKQKQYCNKFNPDFKKGSTSKTSFKKLYVYEVIYVN